MPEEARGYLLCSTPRTGSTWLCGLLESSGVAGHPASYFRKADEQRFSDQWGLSGARDKPLWYSEFVTAAVAAGTTDNGVFAARVMWGTLDEILDRLGTVYSTLERHDLDLLERAFGGLRFVYLRRHDTVAQAVSWFRAEQTDVWHRTQDLDPPGPEHQPRYDFEALDQLVRTIHTNNAAWEHWFTTVGIPPYRVLYEDVESDPTGVTRGILGFLGLELPPGREIISRQVRLRDPLSAEWISRYRTQAEREAGLGGGTSFLVKSKQFGNILLPRDNTEEPGRWPRVDAREERFRDMYEAALNRVVAYALRRTVSYEDAADVVAETFAIAWRRLDEIPTGQREVPWLYVVARRVIANRVRGEANRSDVVQRLAHQLTTAAHQHRELDADRLSALDALRHLTDEDREVLMLVAWDGLSSQQLGWALSCSPTAARIRLHRARARLRALLTDDRSTTVEPSPQLQEVPEP